MTMDDEPADLERRIASFLAQTWDDYWQVRATPIDQLRLEATKRIDEAEQVSAFRDARPPRTFDRRPGGAARPCVCGRGHPHDDLGGPDLPRHSSPRRDDARAAPADGRAGGQRGPPPGEWALRVVGAKRRADHGRGRRGDRRSGRRPRGLAHISTWSQMVTVAHEAGAPDVPGTVAGARRLRAAQMAKAVPEYESAAGHRSGRAARWSAIAAQLAEP